MNLSEGQVWLLIAALTAMSFVVKGIGPALVGGRPLPARASGVIACLAAALLAALVVTSVLADGKQLTVGADTAGVGVAAVLLVLRVPLIVACVVAVVVTAVLRAVT